MRIYPWSASLLLMLSATTFAKDQGTHDPRLKGYQTPDGFKLEIVCEVPTIINPVGMTFGPDGTLFVLEWTPDTNTWPETPEKITYKDGTTRTIATMKKRVKDVVKILTWNAEKQIYDKARIILEDELPSSILIHDGWLYLSGRGTVRRWKLADIIDGKNINAKPEVIAQGFCGFHHHQVSGMTIGMDGWLYITSGDDDNYVEGSDGSRATVLRTGAIFRCRSDGSKMQVFSIGYRNPYRDMVQDDVGNWFHVDNDNEDGSKFTGCRLMHVAEESDFGWRLFPGARCCKPDHLRGAAKGELPGKMAPMLNTGRGAPAGLLYYNDTQLPEYYRGLLWYPDVFRKLIRAYRVAAEGATFKVAQEMEILKSDDPLFRPCQMITGPDGAIYICDWRTDSGGAGKLFGDGLHGRIYRMSWAGGKVPGLDEVVPAIKIGQRSHPWECFNPKASSDTLYEGICHDDATVRKHAQLEYVRRAPTYPADVRRFLLKDLDKDAERSTATRALCLGALSSVWNDEVRDVVIKLLIDQSSDIRRLAAESLATNGTPRDATIQAALVKVIGDDDLAVRRAVALAMGKLNADDAADVLLNAYKFDEGKDPYLWDGYLRAIERCGKSGIDKLIGLAKSGDDGDRDKALYAFTCLRIRQAAEAIPELLGDPHVKPAERIQIIKSYANYQLDPPISLDPLVDFLTRNPKEPLTVQAAAIEVVSEAGNLRGAKITNLLTNLFDSPDEEVRLSAIRSIEVSRFTEAVPRLNQSLADKNRSVGERIAVLKALRVLNDKSVVNGLKVFFDSPEPIALRLEALRTLAAIDADAVRPIAEKLLEQTDAGLLREAIAALGTKPEGAKLVGHRFVDKKLPSELLPQISDALRKHADKDALAAKLLTEVMKGGLLVSLEPAQVEKVRQLVLTKGSPSRGKVLYLTSKTLNCVTCHKLEGIGGQVGPDLTRLWETATIEKIMEAIIDPSSEIKEGYQAFRALTKSGQTYNGLKVVDKPEEVVIRDAAGKDIRIARRDVEDLPALTTSLMPTNAIAQISFDQFLDLVAFLKSRDAQESLRGMANEFLIVGPFNNDLQTAYGPETNTDSKATYEGLDGKKITWQSRQVEPNGLLDLRAAFGKDRISAYALTYVYSPKQQEARLLIGADDTLRVWINGKQVHENVLARTATPDEDRVKVELNEGWNPVLVKVANRLDAHGLYLRFAGDGLKMGIKK